MEKKHKRTKEDNGQEMKSESKSVRAEVKKSALNAKDEYDYRKLCADRPGLIPCSYEEDREDLYFSYKMAGKHPFSEIKSGTREMKYQLLINFAMLSELLDSYALFLREDNIYYDENYIVYIKERDIYARGEKPDENEFLAAYKSFVAGVLGSKYSVSQILDSGIEICKDEKWFGSVYACKTPEEIVEILHKAKKGL